MVIQSERKGERGGEFEEEKKEKKEKGHMEGSRVRDGEIRKTEGGKRRQWADGRVR